MKEAQITLTLPQLFIVDHGIRSRLKRPGISIIDKVSEEETLDMINKGIRQIIDKQKSMVPIDGYEGLYSIAHDGNVWSHKRNKYLKVISGTGSKYVNLYDQHKVSTKFYISEKLLKRYFG